MKISPRRQRSTRHHSSTLPAYKIARYLDLTLAELIVKLAKGDTDVPPPLSRRPEDPIRYHWKGFVAWYTNRISQKVAHRNPVICLY